VILVKGTHVAFDLAKGGTLERPARDGMLHDESGEVWPKSSVLVGPFEKTARPVDAGAAGAAYFGAGYQTRGALVHLPPRDLGAWTKVGKVTVVWYVRPGTRAPGPFRHEYGGGWETFFLGKGHQPVLYRSGKWVRLELGRGAVVDDRGFVRP
jgi:hypothetical protein